VVLDEKLTGGQIRVRETISDSQAAVLTTEPNAKSLTRGGLSRPGNC
jgi:hypothetical protein